MFVFVWSKCISFATFTQDFIVMTCGKGVQHVYRICQHQHIPHPVGRESNLSFIVSFQINKEHPDAVDKCACKRVLHH